MVEAKSAVGKLLTTVPKTRNTCADKLTPPIRDEVEALEFKAAAIVRIVVSEALPQDKPCHLSDRGLHKGNGALNSSSEPRDALRVHSKAEVPGPGELSSVSPPGPAHTWGAAVLPEITPDGGAGSTSAAAAAVSDAGS